MVKINYVDFLFFQVADKAKIIRQNQKFSLAYMCDRCIRYADPMKKPG